MAWAGQGLEVSFHAFASIDDCCPLASRYRCCTSIYVLVNIANIALPSHEACKVATRSDPRRL